MSHVVTAETRFTDRRLLKAAADRLKVECRVAAPGEYVTEKLYETLVTGMASVRLKGWSYPVVVKEGGDAVYDNYNGAWGDPQEFTGLKCAYAEVSAAENFQSQGYFLTSETETEEYRELVYSL